MKIVLSESRDIAINLVDETVGINSTAVGLPQEEGGEGISAPGLVVGIARDGGFPGGEINGAGGP